MTQNRRNEQEIVFDRQDSLVSDTDVSSLSAQFGTLDLLIEKFLTIFDQEFMPWLRQAQQHTTSFDKHSIGKTSSQVLSMYHDIQALLCDVQAIRDMNYNIGTNLENDENINLHDLTTQMRVLEKSLQRISIERKRGRLSTQVLKTVL